MNNWKSLIAFFTILATYVYSVAKEMTSETISITGTLAIVALLAMMGRSEQLLDILKTVTEALKTKWSK